MLKKCSKPYGLTLQPQMTKAAPAKSHPIEGLGAGGHGTSQHALWPASLRDGHALEVRPCHWEPPGQRCSGGALFSTPLVPLLPLQLPCRQAVAAGVEAGLKGALVPLVCTGSQCDTEVEHGWGRYASCSEPQETSQPSEGLPPTRHLLPAL